MAQRERDAAPHRNDSADKFAPFSRWSLPAAGAPWLIIEAWFGDLFDELFSTRH
jgi:hypothetical protein